MTDFQLTAVSPIDGRYGGKTALLQTYFSEFGLIRYRVRVELQWLKKLVAEPCFELPSVSGSCLSYLDSIYLDFSVSDGIRVKELESVTNHDMKAVEYFIKEKLDQHSEGKLLKEYVHFTCTSEDINNLAYGLMLEESLTSVIIPQLESLLAAMASLAQATAHVPLLALTHGQSATPSTFGRELTVFLHRLKSQLANLRSVPIMGKFNGATGSFNAHFLAYPKVDWEALSRELVEGSLNLVYQPVSTQIECHDYISELADVTSRISSILVGFSRDMWTYISRGVLKLKVVSGEVGSSTMPHKVNPIDFENAEGNLGISVALFDHFSDKLVISRLQRDLSDSTVLRNIGVAYGHFLISVDSLKKGLSKVDVNAGFCEAELSRNWALLAEPIQTIMRKNGIANPYEQLKSFTRGAEVGETEMKQFINSLEGKVCEADFSVISNLTPQTYTGLAEVIAKKYGTFP